MVAIFEELGAGSGLSAGREKIVSGIGSPLGFFVLALLIVEAFLFGAGWAFNLPVETRTYMVWAGIGLFVFVLVTVLILVIWFPQNLVFTERSHLHLALFGYKSKPLTVGLMNSTALTAPTTTPPQLPPSVGGGSPDVQSSEEGPLK